MSTVILTLRLLQHLHVLGIFWRETLQKPGHIEAIKQARLPLLFIWRRQKLSVRIEQGCKAACKGRAHLLWVESHRADNADLLSTPTMSVDAASSTPIDPILGLVVAYSAHRAVVMISPLQAMTLNPVGRLGVPDRLHQHVRHHG